MKQVNYINACATSRIVDDVAEVNAIKRVFKNTSEIKVNGTKVKSGCKKETLWSIPTNTLLALTYVLIIYAFTYPVATYYLAYLPTGLILYTIDYQDET